MPCLLNFGNIQKRSDGVGSPYRLPLGAIKTRKNVGRQHRTQNFIFVTIRICFVADVMNFYCRHNRQINRNPFFFKLAIQLYFMPGNCSQRIPQRVFILGYDDLSGFKSHRYRYTSGTPREKYPFSQRVACFKYSAETEPVPTIPVVPKEPPHKESTFLY